MAKKVVIADDDRVFVELLATRLRAKGFEVTVAFDSLQAFMSALRVLPDAMLLDVSMPGGTGIDTLRKVKANVRTASTLVLVATASSDPRLEEQAKALGAAAYLHKPVGFVEVHSTLTWLLEAPRAQAV